MIKTVIFDIGNVLTGFRWQEFFASFGYSEETLTKIARATVMSPYWSEYDMGTMTEEEVLRLFIQNDPSIEKELRESLADITNLLVRYDYAIPWIKELHEKGLQVLYLSNFSEKALRECAHVLDFLPYTDGGIFSCRVHLIKPNPAIYKLLLSTYGLKAEECVFLDDTLANIEAAEALGIHGIHFQNKEQAQKELAALGIN